MDDPSEGCYCAQALACPHWIAAKMDRRLVTAQEHSHARAKTFEQELQQDDQRPIVSKLQRELRTAMLEIEKLAKTSRDLAKINQELEESRLLAVNDQARTARRLTMVSSQLEHTEQQLFKLTKEIDKGQKDSELLRIERIKKEALQEREDAGRLKIEALQEELQDVQRSEQSLQLKLTTIQNKYETLSKRHDNLKRQQQELELARESKEALAWLKETTDRLCSPPQGGLNQHERSSSISIHRSSPPSSPPYPSSYIDPPLAAQNQLISLIKELATTNSTLRSELNEYRDLLQDTRNEMLSLRSQVEDYEQGHAFANCCGSKVDDSESFRTSRSAWSNLDIGMGGGLDAVSHIGTLGSLPGSPPPYMTTPKASRHPSHHRLHVTGVRGNVFGELERLYSQSYQDSSVPMEPRRHGKTYSSKKSNQTLASIDQELAGHVQNNISTSIHTSEARRSISEARRASTSTLKSVRSPPNPMSSSLHDQYDLDNSSPTSNSSRGRISMYKDTSVDVLDSGSDSGDEIGQHRHGVDSLNPSSDAAGLEENKNLPGIVSQSAETNQLSNMGSPDRKYSQHVRQSLTLLPPADLDEPISSIHDATDMFDSTMNDNLDPSLEGHFRSRTSPISLLSAELQRATQSETKNEVFSGGDDELASLEHGISPLAEVPTLAFDEGVVLDGNAQELSGTLNHEESSNIGFTNSRQQRRLSEPLSHQLSSSSLPAKKSRPSSIYSLRRPHPRMDASSAHCIHSPHVTSTSAGSIPELQRCKSAELVEQIIAEQRQRTMEAWRVGVVAAAVTQQQSIHSVVAFGEQRRDMDNISIRSKASRRRVKGSITTGAFVEENKGGADDLDILEVSNPNTHTLPSNDSESTIRETHPSEENSAKKIGLVNFPDSNDATRSHLTIDTEISLVAETNKSSQDKASKDKKRHSVRSMRSIRSSLLRSPMARSSLLARDGRFPSEASTASEAFSHRRYDHEHSPYQLLHTLSMDLLERLARSDTRELNRRLKRTFDIQALSQMSNSVIENVLTDVNNLGERFRWLEEQVADPIDEMLDHQPVDALASGEDGSESEQDDIDEDALDDQEEEEWSFSVQEFFPLAHTVQEMLSEIGKLRMTINELQLSYVLKVEEDRIKAEKAFLQNQTSDDEDEYDDLPIMNPRLSQISKKPTQEKNVIGVRDRPRILGSASTGVSGFFNKVFGGGNQPPQESAAPSTAPKPSVNVDEAPKDKPSISTSKSGIVVAETSRIIADSPWISSPGNPAAPKSVSQSVVADTPRRSGTISITTPGSRLSATTSLAAMATMSPARPSTVHVTEGLAIAHLASSTISPPIDISVKPNQDNTRHSPINTTSPTAISARGMLSRSLSQTRADDLHLSEADAETRFERLEQTHVPASYRSTSIVFDEVKVPHTSFVTNQSDPDLSNATTSLRAPGQRPLTLDKAPRSIGISTRTSGPALNIVTKQDVFQEHWTSSTSSSFSATISSVPSRATSERQATLDSVGEGTTPAELQKGNSSITSISSNSISSEVSSAAGHKPISKPTLITRSALTAATPSTSTVSSPISTTSWLDNNRTFPSGNVPEMNLGSESKTSESYVAPAGALIEPESAPGPTSGSTSTTGEHKSHYKPRTTKSFHADAALNGSSDSLTRSLGRAGGRESALAFLRGEVQVTSILGSLFQSQPPTQGQSLSRSTSLRRTDSNWALKGKQLASDGQFDSSRNSIEVLTGDPEERTGDEDSNIHGLSSNQATITSRSDSSAHLGSISTPTTSLSQRTAVTSTAVAYVVATPDAHGTDDKDRKKRAVFDRDLIKASQKRILAGIPHQDKPFEPQAGPRRARALSVDSAQSTEPLKANEIMDIWRVGAGVSRDIWRGLIKKVDGRDS
ncbi:hypothetical protein BGZ49_007725 [Haplosporangium sp. Z 27]|nr:hypothetical protein BGZ49_007725 [Haplosporangium sp. Z 27]